VSPLSDILTGEPLAKALTWSYRAAGDYVDCYFTELARPVTFAQYVEAFYTTTIFKSERLILRYLAARASTDAEARQLAHGERESFAAWSLVSRAPDQILMRDFTGRTYSWLMTEAIEPGATRLYFGSVITRVRDAGTGRTSLGPVHGRLLGFHKFYSRLLLRAAAHKLSALHTSSR
jgi:hypothetical protein